MSTYIPGITDAIPDTPLYHPDTGFFNQMLMKKTQMYNQGLSQVQNAYSSVLNAPLSDQTNVDMRNSYVQQAQDKLKDLSSADLSLDANVQSAENVYAPFWQDDLMVKDVAYTKNAQAQLSQGAMYRDSTDEKQRSLYNDISMQDINNGLNQLRGAGRDPQKYAQLTQRRFTPFVNIPQTLDSSAKEEGLKIDWTSDPDGPYLVNETNGQRSVKSFRAFAEGHMTPQMQDQFNVTGRVEFENRVNQYKQNNPGVTDDQAKDYISKDAASQYANQFKSTISGFTADRDNLQTQIDNFKKNLGTQQPTSQQKDYITQLLQERENLGNQIAAKNTEFNQHWQAGGDQFEQLHQNIAANPEHYFASMAKNTTIDNWAIGRAANSSRTVTENPVWKTQMDNDYKAKQLQIDSGKLDIEKQNLDLKREALGLKYGVNPGPGEPGSPGVPGGGFGTGPYTLDPNGNIVANTNYNPNSEKGFYNQGHLLGKDTNDVTKVGDPASAYYADQLTKTGIANELITSPDGLAGVLTHVGNGVTHSDVINISSYLKNMLRDPEGYNPNADQKASYAKVVSAVAAQTGQKIEGPGSFRNALVAYAGKYFTDRNNNAAAPLTDEETSQFLAYNKANDILTQLNTNANLKNQLAKSYIAGNQDPDFQKLLVTRKDGNKDIIHDADVTPFFHAGKYKLEPAGAQGDGVGQTFTSQQLAGLYLQGKLKMTQNSGGPGYSLDINGKTYVQTDLKGLPKDTSNPYAPDRYSNDVTDVLGTLQDRYGSSEDVAAAYKKAYNDIIPKMPQYSAQTGRYGTITQYDIPTKDPKDGPAMGTLLSQEIANDANHTGIYVDGELSTDPKLNKAIAAMASESQDGEHHNIVSVIHHTNGVTGTPSIELKFNPVISSTDKHMIDDEKLSALAGKSIELPIASSSTGANLAKLPSGSNAYVYGDMMYGKTFTANPLEKAMGFDYTIQPDDPQHPTGAYVSINTSSFNKGSMVPDQSKPFFIPFSGPTGKSPDEIKGYVNQKLQQHIAENKLNRELYQKQNQTGNGQTINDLIDNYGK